MSHKGRRKTNDLLRRILDRILSVQKWRKLGKESKMAESRTESPQQGRGDRQKVI